TPLPAAPVLSAATVAADLQAAADDERLRSLLPDRALLPRRGPARRAPAGVHAARHRDFVPQPGTDHPDDGGVPPSPVEDRARGGAAAAVPAAHVRGSDAPLRLRQAGPAHPARA